MRIAILDPAAGISGDMTLGALLSLGVPSAWLEGLPGRLGLAGVGVSVRDVVRCGLRCMQVEFAIPEQPHGRAVGELVRLVERAMSERSEGYVREIYSYLRDYAIASRDNRPIGDKMILNAAFLIERDKTELFDQKVKELAEMYEGRLKLVFSGPWPPYNFVNIRLKLERAGAPD